MPERPEEETTTTPKPFMRIFGVQVEKTVPLTQLFYLLAAIVGFMWLVFGKLNTVEANQIELAKVRTEMTEKLNGLRSEILDKVLSQQQAQTRQLTDIQVSISNLPDVRATLNALEKRADQADNRAAAQSARMDQVQAVGVQNSSDIVGLLRSLTGAPRQGVH